MFGLCRIVSLKPSSRKNDFSPLPAMSTLYQGLFYYYGSSFVPFDSPLWHFKQDSPDGLLLFSLAEPESPNVAPFELGSDLALVVNLTRVSLQARKYLKSKVWPGQFQKAVRTAIEPPFPVILDSDLIIQLRKQAASFRSSIRQINTLTPWTPTLPSDPPIRAAPPLRHQDRI